jgi:redox-sensitive bicupin YhaK (pirin superfamily)
MDLFQSEMACPKEQKSMNMTARPSSDRGYFDHGWLKSHHSFSFGDYYDANWMGFRQLRVINEDYIAAKSGFPMHGHRNMEILTLVLTGELAHKDSMGNESTIGANEIQLMHAGSGVKHSEYNPSPDKETHLLQIWITPDQTGITPGYSQKKLSDKNEEWQLLVSKTGKDSSLQIHQDVSVYLCSCTKDKTVKLEEGRFGWIQLISGTLLVAGKTLHAGDALAIEPSNELVLQPKDSAKFLFFDLN